MGVAADAYEQGFKAGYADSCLVIDNPAGVNGHTVERFMAIRDCYDAAILAAWPSAYQCGYAAGFDQRAEESASAREAATTVSPT
jgi:hypothetical protein